MVGLDSIHLDGAGLELREREIARDNETRIRAWSSREGDGVGLFFFSLVPDLAGSLDDIDALRRDLRSRTPALLEAERVRLDGCDCLRTIVKVPQQPHGMTYVGSLTLPFRDCSWVLKAQCEERGMTGMREAVVLDRHMSEVKMPEREGWQGDPYDPAFRAPLQRNLADDEKYDAEFPHHPLSRLRRLLRLLSDTVRVDDEARALPPFLGPSLRARRKKWWPF